MEHVFSSFKVISDVNHLVDGVALFRSTMAFVTSNKGNIATYLNANSFASDSATDLVNDVVIAFVDSNDYLIY